MTRSPGWYCLVLSLMVLLVVGAGSLAQAEFTKLYRFMNNTASAKGGVRAVTNGMEVITADFVAPDRWGYEPYPKIANILFSGAYCTKLKWEGGEVASGGGPVKVGWRTADNSCRLRDLRWVTTAGYVAGPVVDPELLQGIPGGGYSFYDPDTRELVVVITNDTEDVIYLTGTDFGVFESELDLSDLEYIAEAGMVGMRVSDINKAMDALREEVVEAGDAGTIPSPSARSLTRKLDKAEAHNLAGLDAYTQGDVDGALVFWGRAVKQMTNFISEVSNQSDRGNVPPPLDEQWIATAEDIKTRLENLPGIGASPVEGVLLQPGESFEFRVSDVDLGAGVVLQGSVLDAAGNSVLDWVEQTTATPEVPDTTPPEIIAASIDPNELWPPDHERVEMSLTVTVTDLDDELNSRPAAWYIESADSNQPVDGSGDGDSSPDWWLDPQNDVQYLALRRERSGNLETRTYTVTLRAIDMAGNLSDPYEVTVDVDHDEGETKTAITSLAAVPVRGRAVQITFTLASPGEVQAEVLNIAGRRIKTIVADRKSDKGTTSLIWNCQNERGLAVPAGTYLIRLTARTADGQQAAALCAVTLRP